MTEENPYAPPQEVGRQPGTLVPWGVDGRFLVVSDNAVLPNRCVVTGQPLDDQYVMQSILSWAPSFRLVMSETTCNLAYYLSPEVRKQRFTQNAIYQSIIILIAAFLFVFIVDLWLMCVVLAIQLYRIVRPDYVPLKINKVEGGYFWIEGCGDEFLQYCESKLGLFDPDAGASERDSEGPVINEISSTP